MPGIPALSTDLQASIRIYIDLFFLNAVLLMEMSA